MACSGGDRRQRRKQGAKAGAAASRMQGESRRRRWEPQPVFASEEKAPHRPVIAPAFSFTSHLFFAYCKYKEKQEVLTLKRLKNITEKSKHKDALFIAKTLLFLSIPLISSALGLTYLAVHHALFVSSESAICCGIGAFIVSLWAIAEFWFGLSFCNK